MAALYDRIGDGYAARRQPDPRIRAAIEDALSDAATVVNVGAGAGSYEPAARRVVAVEPAFTMIRQRPPGSAPVVCASALDLPLAAASFEAALAVLTLHHWTDRDRGLREMARVARGRIVILTWDPSPPAFWLTDDYFPDIIAMDRDIFPTLADFEHVLGPVEVRRVLVPHDCTDGFLGAYWRRPAAYLDPGVRAAISAFTKLHRVDERIDQLRRDLADGTWAARNASVLAQEEIDLGYRLVVRACASPH